MLSNAVAVTLEHGFDGAVGAVAHPARKPEGACAVAGLDAEEDALHAPVDTNARPRHSLKPSFPTSGTNRHGTERTTAGPSGLLTIS